MRRLHLNLWKNIIRNTNELGEDIEILWLEDTDEYVLCADTEIFEDGFKDEYEAERRLERVLSDLNMMLEEKIEDDDYYKEKYHDYIEEFPIATLKSMDFDEIVGYYLSKHGENAYDVWEEDYTNKTNIPNWIQDRVTRALNILINMRGL